MTIPKVWAFAPFLLLALWSPKTMAQEDFDVPPPPPMEDFEDPEGVPYEEDVTEGPVFDAPPDEARPYTPPPAIPGGMPQIPQNSSGGIGFSPPAPSFRGGGNSFGSSTPSDGKFRFKIVEGEFWEKGKKRGRGKTITP